MSTSGNEFREIGHTGGQYKVNVKTDASGRGSINFGYRHSRPTQASFFGVYFLPEGIPVGMMRLGGIGQVDNSSPLPSGLPIYIASDSEGMFGHQCRRCNGYWRSKCFSSQWKTTCPYCGYRAESHTFLTEGQIKYANECCKLIMQALSSDKDGESVVDMDMVADAIGKDHEKPKFYYSEQSQQNKFMCQSCGELNDILGKYGYCCDCGTYNGYQELRAEIENIGKRIKEGQNFESCVTDTVSAFDSFARKMVKQLTQRIPMTPSRRKEWDRRLFHNIKSCISDFKTVFDIDGFKELKQSEIDFIVRIFHRRHVYEHNGGEVDEKYIRDSGDTSVRLKQVIHETSETAIRTGEHILKIAHNFSDGFHTIFPTEEKPIQLWKERQKH